jgi:inhibitor of cysteine peptidase
MSSQEGEKCMLQLIEILTRLLLGLFFWVGIVTVSPGRPPEPVEEMMPPLSEQTVRSITVITAVDIIVLESFPMQVQLHISGEHADGCDLPVTVEQRREGNTVTVTVYRELPIDLLCPMILLPYEYTIPLEGSFEPGDYVFRVNDFVLEQTL